MTWPEAAVWIAGLLAVPLSVWGFAWGARG
jgi:hypothetical protein